jgi:hypothetical protein
MAAIPCPQRRVFDEGTATWKLTETVWKTHEAVTQYAVWITDDVECKWIGDVCTYEKYVEKQDHVVVGNRSQERGQTSGSLVIEVVQ